MLMIIDDFLKPPEERTINIVRVETSYWHTKRGFFVKKSIIPMKKLSSGYQLLEEDCDMAGAEETLNRIINLNNVKDGIYQLVTCNEHKDWETGIIEDYNYKLIPFQPA